MKHTTQLPAARVACQSSLRRACWPALLTAAALLPGCAAERPLRTPTVTDAIRAELAPTANVSVPARISEALAEPVPPLPAQAAPPRLDLLLTNAQARDVFLAIVSDTRYSMMVHPDISGTMSLTLRGVTVLEALEAIRDVYGFDFKVEGRRISVFPATLQTRVFTINYPHNQRSGSSELRVSSGGMNAAGGSSGATNSGATSAGATGASGSSGSQIEGSRIATNSRTDYWAELTEAIKAMVGSGAGRSVIASPQAGIMAVRAMPDELRRVDSFLKAAKMAVERQVMLEAKIVEVELRDGFQSGIDWSALRNGRRSTGVVGSLGGGTSNNVLIDGVTGNVPGFSATAASVLSDRLQLPAAGGGLFGLALASDGFQAVLGFLETRGDVQILSSPRIAAMNNQKALLKVGTDEYFITNMVPGTPGTANTAGTATSYTFASFFSGIALDVTPQIDDANNITLHVRPSVTSVVDKPKVIDLGNGTSTSLQMASSSVNESDTLVRIQDGHIVAIGGLMRIESDRRASGLPGSTDIPFFSSLLGNRVNSGRKKELVVLIKPTIIRSAEDWEQQTLRSRSALDDHDDARSRVIRIDGTLLVPPPRPPE